MKPHLHMGHAFAGLFLSAALLATAQAPPQLPAPGPSTLQLPGPPVTADDARPPAPGSLADFVSANPACREISDGCQVCVRGANNNAQCSTPGIACAPTGWQCGLPHEKTAQ